jgi:hypothetical protein
MNDPYLADHFHPLQEASKAILQALRDDESSPQGDLYKRLVSGGEGRYHAAVNGGCSCIKLFWCFICNRF